MNVRPLPEAAALGALQSFADVLALIEAKRDVTLKLDVERYVRPIDLKPGAIRFAMADGAPANLAQRLSGRLKEWTGRPWMMDIASGGAEGVETAWERGKREDVEERVRIEQDPFVQSVMAAFPGAELLPVRKITGPAPSGDDPVEADEDD